MPVNEKESPPGKLNLALHINHIRLLTVAFLFVEAVALIAALSRCWFVVDHHHLEASCGLDDFAGAMAFDCRSKFRAALN